MNWTTFGVIFIFACVEAIAKVYQWEKEKKYAIHRGELMVETMKYCIQHQFINLPESFERLIYDICHGRFDKVEITRFKHYLEDLDASFGSSI